MPTPTPAPKKPNLRMTAMRERAYNAIMDGEPLTRSSTTALWEVARRLHARGLNYQLADVLIEIYNRCEPIADVAPLILKTEIGDRHQADDTDTEEPRGVQPGDAARIIERLESHGWTPDALIERIGCTPDAFERARAGECLEWTEHARLVLLSTAASDSGTLHQSDAGRTVSETPDTDTAHQDAPALALEPDAAPLAMLRTVKDAGRTQKEIAERIGMDRADVSKVMSGKRPFPLDKLDKLRALYREITNQADEAR